MKCFKEDSEFGFLPFEKKIIHEKTLSYTLKAFLHYSSVESCVHFGHWYHKICQKPLVKKYLTSLKRKWPIYLYSIG